MSGLHLLGDSLRRRAGHHARRFLTTLTKTPISGLLTGTVVTAVIQSSSATNVIVVGLVHAGLLSLPGAMGVMLGANVGTTVTAQLLAFDVSRLAPVFVATGVLFAVRGRYGAKRPARAVTADVGGIFVGFGALLLGLEALRMSLAPLAAMPWARLLLANVGTNAYAAVGAGALLTAVLQSSSATTALTIAVARTGLLGSEAAIGIVLGANVGTVATTMLASIRTRTAAKRAAVADLVFNAAGVLLFMPFLSVFARIIATTGADVGRQVANAHTVFNVVTAVAVLPFVPVFVRFITRLVPGTAGEEGFDRKQN